MRNTRWGSPVGIALITAGGAIAAAIITGIFTLVVITRDSEPASKVFIASSQPQPEAEVKFLGDGFANVEGPSTISVGSSARVALTVSLDQQVRAKDVIWRATPTGQPTVKAGPVGTSANLQDAELEDVPIYSEMQARLDAPAFRYLETDWVTKPISLTATWIWNISPAKGVGPQAVKVFISGPEGAGYEGIVQHEVAIVPIGLEPTQTPIPTPSPTPTTPKDTPIPLPATPTPSPISPPSPTPAPLLPDPTPLIPTPTATATPVPTPTPTPTAGPTDTPVLTPTPTPVPTPTRYSRSHSDARPDAHRYSCAHAYPDADDRAHSDAHGYARPAAHSNTHTHTHAHAFTLPYRLLLGSRRQL